jgi:starch synthase (maltosyl-transferring)
MERERDLERERARREPRRKTRGPPAIKKASDERRLGSIAIEDVYPEVDGGLFPAKRVVGDTMEISADIFKLGHDIIRARLRFQEGSSNWQAVPMTYFDNDRWVGRFSLASPGMYRYTIEAWTDRFGGVLQGLEKWLSAEEDVTADLEALRDLVERAAENAVDEDRAVLESVAAVLRKQNPQEALDALNQPKVIDLMTNYGEREDLVTYRTLGVFVDPIIAGYAAWYEMFHRSQGAEPGRSATFSDCEKRLPEIQGMGFDVIYLPPIHPIGRTNRRGPNNSPDAGPGDPGSPWAIGSEEGGHMSVHPDLGTVDDFVHFIRAAKALGMDVALDLAFQCSPDHPYVREHPEWFYHRSDGTIRYAENPPKRYQDIYPLFFGNEHSNELWEELLRVTLFWVDKGVKQFRVDNPHTKPAHFWEWLIGNVKQNHPEVVFLAEAFTHPKPMKLLAKLGFSQSYTYFTWKNKKGELIELMNEFAFSGAAEYYRGNFFTNTPDILTEYLQKGGRPAFQIRLVLAATLSPLYGIYNGYELCENRASAPGSEEYLDSEKYQYKVWDWERPGNIKDYIARLNMTRRENPALHNARNLRILRAENENIFFYGRWTPDRSNIVLVAVNLDPSNTHDSAVFVPIDALGIKPSEPYTVRDSLTGAEFRWIGEANYVKLDPRVAPAHILLVKR